MGVHAWHMLHGRPWLLNSDTLKATIEGVACLALPSAKHPQCDPFTPDIITLFKSQLSPDDPLEAAVFTCIAVCFWGIVSWPWHPINPVPLCPIMSTCLPPILLYVALFPDCPYSLRIATNQWALCLVRLPLQLLNMFPFTILVTLCSRPVILTNTICLGELATSITELTHCAVQTALIVGLPDPLSIALYILQ